MNSSQNQRLYMQRGMTLIEVLATCVIMGLVGAGIAGLVMLNGMSELRMSNKVDNLNAARNTIERIGKDVRMARNVADIYGQRVQLGTDPVTGNPVYGFLGTNVFPDSQNPIYSFGSPTGGWPSAPWPAQPYTLGPTCLIIQVPVFDSNGFPTSLPTGFGTPPLANPMDNVDTTVYNLVSDPDNTGTWMLQAAGFPGNRPGAASNYSNPPPPLSNPPVTLVKGIVGPIDPGTGQPKVFQFLDRTLPNADPYTSGIGSPPGATNANLTGIIVQFEIRTNVNGSNQPATIGLKTEVYARNNTMSTINVPP